MSGLAIQGFVNISAALQCGVYALAYRGEVVYIGQSKCMLVRVYSHRSARNKRGKLPSWFPIRGILFDEVHVRPCHPDRVSELERSLIAEYKPKYNVRLKAPGPISVPFELTVGNMAILVNSDQHPYISGKLERRV